MKLVHISKVPRGRWTIRVGYVLESDSVTWAYYIKAPGVAFPKSPSSTVCVAYLGMFLGRPGRADPAKRLTKKICSPRMTVGPHFSV
jgi:hypothetical protein